MLYWGLVPAWAKDKSVGARMINARAETLREKPAYRDAYRRRRALVRRRWLLRMDAARRRR